MTEIPLRDPRYRSLDVWRGLICMMVVFEHTAVALWSGKLQGHGIEGWLRRLIVTPLEWNLGAPLFFVISGYCVATSIDSHRRRERSGLTFLARRFWRIFPPYWAALLLFVAVVATLDAFGLERLHKSANALELSSPNSLNLPQWLGNLTLTETWRWHIIKGEPAIFTRVGWSLCYQEQFYLVCVLTMALAPRRFYGALALSTAAILLVRIEAWDIGFNRHIEGGFTDLWHEFAVGLGVYWRLNVAARRLSKRFVELALLGLLAIGVQQDLKTTVASAAFGLILIGCRRWDAGIERMAWLNSLRALGRRSYSIYLVHLPAAMVVTALLSEWGISEFWSRALVTVPLSSAAALVAGWVFHSAVDRHFHQFPARRPRRAVCLDSQPLVHAQAV